MVKAGVLMRDATPCYYVYRLTWRDRDADRARRGRLARRLRDQPHPQARADDAGEGGRPRPPDRGGQRPDRPGDDRPIRPRPRSTRCWRSAAAGDADVDVTADDGVRHQMWVVDDERDHRRADARRSMRCRRSTSPTATTARRRPRASRRRAAAPAARTAISSPCSFRITR